MSHRSRKQNRNAHSGALENIAWDVEAFSTYPFRAGSSIRKLHAAGDPRRFDFADGLREYIQTVPTEDEWDSLIRGELPQALMDIILDVKLYDSLLTMSEESRQYVFDLYTSLALITGLTIPTHGWTKVKHTDGRAKWITYLIRRFPELWLLLLNRRHLIALDCDSDDEDCFTQSIVDVILCYIGVCKLRNITPTPGQDNTADIAAVCWLYSKSTKITFALMAALVRICQHSSEREWASFIGNTLDKRLGVEHYLLRCSYTLLKDDCLDGALTQLLRHMYDIGDHPAVKAARAENKELAVAILSACQRQVCSGSEEDVWYIIQCTFAHIIRMATHDPATRRYATSHTFYHYIMLLSARALVPAAKEPNPEHLAPLECMITSYACIGEEYAEDIPEIWEFKESVRNIWHRAYDDLKSLSPSIAPNRSQVMGWWKLLGEKSGVDINAEYVPATEVILADGTKRSIRSLRKRGCGWRECMCFGERRYHTMRKCKRCMDVMYCSKKCQTRDWKEGGHKYVCRPLEVLLEETTLHDSEDEDDEDDEGSEDEDDDSSDDGDDGRSEE